jgi:hypothetical protein
MIGLAGNLAWRKAGAEAAHKLPFSFPAKNRLLFAVRSETICHAFPRLFRRRQWH